MSGYLSGKTRNAYQVFYPLAVLWVAIAIPVWIAQYLGVIDLGLSAQDHAHEMIFGFALAVMTGFLLNGSTRLNLILLTFLWIGGRIFILPEPVLSALHLAFPVFLAYLVAIPLFKNAKSWRNLAFAPILSAFTAAEVLYLFIPEKALLFGLNLTCAMVYMMGGRVVTAVTNGFIQRMGDHLKPGAQSYWETKGFFALLCLVAGDLLGISVLSFAGGLALSIALTMRLYRWEPWRLWTNPQCLWLHIGFGWLLIGLILRMTGQVLQAPYDILGIHTITIAALGTLTLTIMSRTTLQRRRTPIRVPLSALFSLGLINLAVVARILMETNEDVQLWAWLSGGLFSLAFLNFFGWFFLTAKKK